MPEATPQTTDSSTPKGSAPKDKSCPFCGQAFTSSSLGRHLDLYIKDKNPKPPDGLHDVDAIRKLRGGITRRQARGSLGGRREVSTPAGTPKPSSKKDDMLTENDEYDSPAISTVDSAIKYTHPFQPTWEATGVMNDLPKRNSWDTDATPEPTRRPGMQRAVSRQTVQKVQLDVKQKLSDAMDTARAAELALRELLSSWRSAKVQLDHDSMPFDFDPLSLDFPALTLQCLQPPPTLFSSTQHPTSTSWSVQSPGQREFDALRSFFEEEFRAWKVTCATTTTAVIEEFQYPPSAGPFRDVREAVRKAEKSAEKLEAQVTEHLESAYTVWGMLPVQRQQELWILELARGVGRKHKEADKMKDQQHRLKQENASLKYQIELLNRLQQPREFNIAAPVTIPMEKELVAAVYEQALKNGKGVGFCLEDNQVDLSSIVSLSIDRWKNVIATSRANSTGLNAQRPLDQSGSCNGGPMVNGKPQQKSQQQQQQQLQPSQSQGHPQTPHQQAQLPQLQQQQSQQQKMQQQQQQQQQQQLPQPPKRLSTASTNGFSAEQSSNSASTTGPPSIEETSDQDADAEMEDDDSFAIMDPSPVKPPPPPMQQQATLEVPRTRGSVQPRHGNGQNNRFMMPNGNGTAMSRTAINLSRSMPNMNMAMQNGAMPGGDMGMAMQGVRGDPMYME